MNIRPYTPADRNACLAIFDSNTPRFFAPHEQAEFAEFLDAQPSDYFVVEREGDVIACGGFFITPDFGGLCWGMVGTEWHGQRIGWALLIERLQHLCARGISRVRLDTSQNTYGFFAKAGFTVSNTTQDGYMPGLHRYDMELLLDEARCAWLHEQH